MRAFAIVYTSLFSPAEGPGGPGASRTVKATAAGPGAVRGACMGLGRQHREGHRRRRRARGDRGE